METNVTPVEDNPAPKPAGSLIQISSIYIDLKIPKEKDEEDCRNHDFSIREYAAEMRKKNPKASMPFASSDGNLKDAVEKLPPMDAPKFRWWKCPECKRRIKNDSSTEEITTHANCSAASNVSNGDTAMMLSETQQVPTPQSNENSIHDGIGDAAPTGINTGPAEPASDKLVDISGEERATQIGNIIATDDCSDGSLKRVEVSVLAAVNPTAVAPVQAEECGGASFESEQKRKHDNSSGASRRKRKLRYLADLLGDKGNIKRDLPRQDDSSVHKLVVPSGTGTVASQGQAPCVDVGKGSKSPQKSDSDRTVTDIAISNSERQANASSGNKNDSSKRKTEKIPAPGKRKNKQIQVQERFSPRVREQSPSKMNVKESNQHATTADTSLRSSGTSSEAGKTDNHSRNSRSPQEPEREQSNFTQTASQISKYQSSNLKVGLDLSLNSFPDKIDPISNKEKLSSSKIVLEKSDIPSGQCSIMPASEPDVLKNSQLLDLNQNEMSCHQEKSSEGQVYPKEINKLSDQMASNRISQGSSDDIPMEIVELMAKNQYERGLADAGNQSFRQRINNSVRRIPEVQGMGPMTQFVRGIPGMTSFSPANARSGMGMGGANAGTAKGNSINYSQMNRNHFEVVQPEKNKVSIYNMFPQNQHVFSRRMQHPVSASVGHSERPETLSSSKALNISFGLGMQQKYHAQNPESQHRGKTISDIKADELKKTQGACIILSKTGSSELNIKPKGPVDSYANESIPAMQLLSLMDGRSGNTFNMDSSKPFAPCGYHPRYSTTERRDFLNGSIFQRQNRLAASVGETSGRSSVQHPFAFSGQPQERDRPYLARHTACIPYTGQTSEQGKGKQKATVGASDSTLCLQQSHGRRFPSQNGVSIAKEVRPIRIIAVEEENCVTNLNPAEYFLPDDEENDFTIYGENLKVPKRKYSRDITHDGGKRPRTPKPKAGKEQLENPSS